MWKRLRLTALLPILGLALPLALLPSCTTSPGPAEQPTPPPAPPSVDSPPPKPDAEVKADSIDQAIAAPERSDADRELDPQRQPAQMLRFFGIAPGQRVAELASGGGYTAELLARVVGKEGKVYGQNSPFILERFAEAPWSERLLKESMSNVVRINSEFDAPLPADVKDLDAVLIVLFYHDTVWFETDRAAMNRAVFNALRPGGVYGIVDHNAREGDGITQTKTLHRIEEKDVRREVEAAGFVLAASADFLRSPSDTRDWNASPTTAAERRGTSDRFVLKFVKPLDAAGSSEPPQPQGSVTTCSEPRREMCTRDYRPVCADVDTGIRCIRAPCPSVEQKTYSNGCTACADPHVTGHRPGSCAAPSVNSAPAQ